MCLNPAIVHADETEHRVLVGMTGDVLVPTGEALRDLYNTGFGLSVTGQYHLSTQLAMVLTASYVSFPADAPSGLAIEDGSMIPVVAGFKFSVPAGTVRFFAALDAGVSRVDRWVYAQSGEAVASTTTEFVWQPHLGLETKLGQDSSVEISSRYVAIEGNEAVGIRIGILFGI